MDSKFINMFDDKELIEKIEKRLPILFHMAEIENSRAGRIGMEVGTTRERIIAALLIYYFGEENVEVEIPITESEVDVSVYGHPISIKTITNKYFRGFKLIWTVDSTKAREFFKNYYPTCDMIFVKINWGERSGFYYIPIEVQREIFNKIGKQNYIKLPKKGTNPRGVEITDKALRDLAEHGLTKKINIHWIKTKIDYEPYKRWVDYWKEIK